MGKSIITPTVRLRWIEKDIRSSYAIDNNGNKVFTGSKTVKVLQQYFIYSDGVGEWRDVETESLG